MPDFFSRKERSWVMSRIRGHGNKGTEIAFAKLLRTHRITGWRKQLALRIRSRTSSSVVRTDFVFRKQKAIVFVDGCFWHSCPRHGHIPKGNIAYWKPKLAKNRIRDQYVTRQLRKQGWRVIRIWEHELKGWTKK